MRLWGIADEPFWPALNGSMTSPISVCWRLRISVANRSRLPPRIAIARQQRGVPVALDDLGARRIDPQLQLGHDLGLDLRLEVAVRPDRPGQLAGRDLVDRLGQPAPAAIDLERPAGELEPERGRLGVDGVGPTHHHGAGLGTRPGHEDLDEPVRVAQEQLARRAQLQRERGVDDVRRRQARGAGTGPPARSTRPPATRTR